MLQRLLTAQFVLAAASAAAAATLGPITWTAGGDVRISVAGSFTYEEFHFGERIGFDLQGVRPSSSASKTYTVGGALVRQIRVGDHGSGVRVVIDLEREAAYTVAKTDTGLAVRIVEAAGGKRAKAPARRSRAPAAGARVVEVGRTPPARAQQAAPAPAAAPKRSVESVDPARIEIAPSFALTIEEDTAQDIPYVLKMYKGSIGFGQNASTPLEKIYEGPEWTPVPNGGSTRPIDYFALEFTDDKSRVVNELREKHALPRTLAAFALFPKTFTEALHNEIRAAAARRGVPGKVTRATIVFTMTSEHGVQVKATNVEPN